MILTPEQARRMTGLSQEQCAKALNIAKNTYINKEKGLSPWLYKEAKAFAKLVDLSIDDILFFEDDVT